MWQQTGHVLPSTATVSKACFNYVISDSKSVMFYVDRDIKSVMSYCYCGFKPVTS